MAGEIGLGVTLGCDAAEEDLGKLLSITIPSPEFGMADTTYLGQGDRIKTNIPGMGTPGALDGEMIYENGTVAALAGIQGESCNFTVTFSSGQTFVVPGFLKSYSVEVGSVDDLKKVKFSVQCSGDVSAS